MTDAELLAEYTAERTRIKAVLQKLEEAQGYGIGGRNIQRVQYKDLIARYNALTLACRRLDTSGEGGAATYPLFGVQGGTSDRNGIDP